MAPEKFEALVTVVRGYLDRTSDLDPALVSRLCFVQGLAVHNKTRFRVDVVGVFLDNVEGSCLHIIDQKTLNDLPSVNAWVVGKRLQGYANQTFRDYTEEQFWIAYGPIPMLVQTEEVA